MILFLFTGSYLPSSKHASWIQIKREFNLKGQEQQQHATVFVKEFLIVEEKRDVSISLNVLRQAEVYLDAELIYQTPIEPVSSNKGISINLPELSSGPHTLALVVSNDIGPRMMLIYADKLEISSNHTWKVLDSNGQLHPVMTIDDPIDLPISQLGPNVGEYFVSKLPVSIIVFITVGLLAGNKKIVAKITQANAGDTYTRYFRYLCHVLWLILAINCLSRALSFGLDHQGHMAYINYIIQTSSLPLANQGWQMFQTPLYYIVSAGLFRIGLLLADQSIATEMLRVIPLACGFAQIEIGYRVMKAALPNQAALQIVGLSIITFMPMHLYMSQQIGNEVFAAVFVSATILCVIKFINNPDKLLSSKEQLIFGAVLGAAILSKISALLLIIPSMACLIFVLVKNGINSHRITVIGMRIFFVILLVTGWYFMRNIVELGQPFINGWSAREVTWWQDPGFRTFNDYTRFGQALTHPIFAGAYGFWDSLYSTMWFDGFLSGAHAYESRPPWNYNYAMPAVWFSLIPSVGILLGIHKGLDCQNNALRPILVYCAACIGFYFFAIYLLYATLPIYSTAKATYGLGLLPCFGILAAVGVGRITKSTWSRVPVFGLLGCWAVFSYIGYFQ